MKYLAQNQIKDYTPLTPLPDVRTGEKTTGINELPGYLPNMFNLVIGLAAVIAVGWLIWGGVEYITTDSWTGKEEGKARIKNAIIGLLIIVMSWFILFTINPRLLTLDLNITSTPIQSTGGTLQPGGGGTCTDCTTLASGIKIKSGAGTTVKPDTATKLAQLNSKVNLYVTEAYPPTRTHQNVCHSNGSCIDAAAVPDKDVGSYVKATNDTGLRGIFEVETPERKTQILSSSCGLDQTCRNNLSSSIMVLPPKQDGTRQITGEHFSIYNCSIDAISCQTLK